MDALRPTDERLEPASGTYLEIELRRGGDPEVLEQKRAQIQPGASRQTESETTTVALFVPDEARPVLEQILRDYTSGPLTDIAHVPQHKPQVEAIEAIRQARLETFWTDELDELPTDPQQTIWWKSLVYKGMAEDLAGRCGSARCPRGLRRLSTVLS